jgi:acyl carrier protein
MTREEIKQELQSVFRKVFDDESLEIFDDMTSKDVAEWDSLNHINLVVMVEKRFQIKLTASEVMAMKNVGEFISLIHKKKP